MIFFRIIFGLLLLGLVIGVQEVFADSTQTLEMHICETVNGIHSCRTENVSVTIGKISENENFTFLKDRLIKDVTLGREHFPYVTDALVEQIKNATPENIDTLYQQFLFPKIPKISPVLQKIIDTSKSDDFIHVEISLIGEPHYPDSDYYLTGDARKEAREKYYDQVEEFKKDLVDLLKSNGSEMINDGRGAAFVIVKVPAKLIGEIALRDDVIKIYEEIFSIALGADDVNDTPQYSSESKIMIELEGKDNKIDLEINTEKEQMPLSLVVPNDMISKESKLYVNGVLTSFTIEKKIDESTIIFKYGIEEKSKSIKVLSPKQQLKQGISPEEIICKEGLELIYKPNNSPACVKPSTAEKLVNRGWASS